MSDINLNIKLKINKKFALISAGLLSVFSMASFVSFVDAESAGGIIIEKETMTVGSVVLRIDNKNPADIYGGTWELIRGDASIRLGDGSIQSTQVVGVNDQVVPIPEHSHTATFRGNQLPNHSHSVYGDRGWNGTATFGFSDNGPTGDTYRNTQGASAGTPTGSVTVNNTGVKDAKINVKGAYVQINVWKRIS